ncbi:conserved hypothetical protein [Afipia carboxidovorans OM5]|nr:hypothetical protein [Afipia carboxidovorans]ACI93248.1 conserved hypothetical protein [Afipia carboxidovorans OM5]
MATATNTTPKRPSRRQVEKIISILVDHLDQFEDPDAEPSLGFTEDFYNPTQVGPNFTADANAGDDREMDDSDLEPDVDDEPSLGWTDNSNQASAHFHGGSGYSSGDFEEGLGPVRKKRPRSKTGGAVYRGCRVLGVPRKDEPKTQTVMRVRRKGAAR